MPLSSSPTNVGQSVGAKKRTADDDNVAYMEYFLFSRPVNHLTADRDKHNNNDYVVQQEGIENGTSAATQSLHSSNVGDENEAISEVENSFEICFQKIKKDVIELYREAVAIEGHLRKAENRDVSSMPYSQSAYDSLMNSFSSRLSTIETLTGGQDVKSINHILEAMQEKKDYLTVHLREMNERLEQLKDQRRVQQEAKQKQQQKREKTLQKSLLHDLWVEKQGGCTVLDEKKRDLALRLQRIVKEKIKASEAPTTASAPVLESRQDTASTAAMTISNRSEFYSALLLHLECLWEECIQLPESQRRSTKTLALDSAASGNKDDDVVGAGMNARRTAGGGVCGEVEQDGWRSVVRAMLVSRWDVFPYYRLYGGATEDHLKGKPLHTFLQCLRQVRRQSFVAEEVYRTGLAASPSRSSAQITSRRLNISSERCTTSSGSVLRFFANEKEMMSADFAADLQRINKKYVNLVCDPWLSAAKQLVPCYSLLLQQTVLGSSISSLSERARQSGVTRCQLEWYENGETVELTREGGIVSQRTSALGLSSGGKTRDNQAVRHLVRCDLSDAKHTAPVTSVSSSCVSSASAIVLEKTVAKALHELKRSSDFYHCSSTDGLRCASHSCATDAKGCDEREGDVSLRPSTQQSVYIPFRSISLSPQSQRKYSEEFSVDDFTRHHFVQCALTLTSEAYDEIQRRKAAQAAALHKQRELEDVLAEILEENYKLECILEELTPHSSCE